MSNTTAAAATSFPTLSVLGLIFVTLKLLGVIGWSWWWVTLPFWAPLALLVVLIGGYLLAVLAIMAFTAILVKLGK